MAKKRGIPKILLKSIRHIFGFGYFSSPPFFFLALILFLVLLSKVFYQEMSFIEDSFLLYISLVAFFSIEVLVLLIFLAVHLRAYEFFKDKNVFKASEFDGKIKEKRYIMKEDSLKGTTVDRKFFDFLVFSFYYGVIVMERPFWLIEVLWVVFKKAIKNKKDGLDNFYFWRKLYDDGRQKDYVYYPFVISLNKRLDKISLKLI